MQFYVDWRTSNQCQTFPITSVSEWDRSIHKKYIVEFDKTSTTIWNGRSFDSMKLA